MFIKIYEAVNPSEAKWRPALCALTLKVKVKSRYRPGQAQRFPGS